MIIKATFHEEDGTQLDDLHGGRFEEKGMKFLVDGRSKNLGRFLIVIEKQLDPATNKKLQELLFKEGRAKDG